MRRYYAFNGDADGLCALQQLRLADPREAILVTGVKRDIKLLRRIRAAPGDEVTVLDISLEQNRADVLRLLHGGTSIRYFDHHRAGDWPRHCRFEAYIDEDADVCTSVLVNRYLGGQYRAWAVVAAFGDGLATMGIALAKAAGLDAPTTAILEKLGMYLNYNGYGEAISDLHFDPEALAGMMLPFAHPLDFIRQSRAHEQLGACYEEDMRRARALKPAREVPGATVMVLPDESWARRAIGVLANELTQARPDSAIAILSPKPGGGFTVSVRVPPHSPVDAGDFCRDFETGGGRKLAAGINLLPEEELDRFAARFVIRFGSS
jgi:hypothetical protein